MQKMVVVAEKSREEELLALGFQIARLYGKKDHSASQGAKCVFAFVGTLIKFQNIMNHLGILILQVAVIVVTAKAFGHLIRKFGQPAVMGEMLAGICLGPSLLGWIFPQSETFLFPQ